MVVRNITFIQTTLPLGSISTTLFIPTRHPL
nr:MAG TPA: hypothetical protein [Bacteriophage sp.]